MEGGVMAVLSWFARTRLSDGPDEIELRERLNHEARGAKIFAASFNNEHRRFNIFTRNLAVGKTGYRNTKKDWLEIGVIATGVALLGATVSIMAAAGVITGFLPAGLALAVALIGIGANIGFTRRRNQKTQKEYQSAVEFIEDKKVNHQIHNVQNKIMQRFSNYLNHCSVKEARTFARKTHNIVADAITHKKIQNIDELVSPAYMSMYEKQIPVRKPSSTKNMLGVFARIKANMVGLWKGRKQHEQVVSMNTGFGLFDRPRAERQVVNDLKMQPEVELSSRLKK